MTWVAAAVGGASLLSGIIGAGAAGSAADQQAAAAAKAQAISQQQWNITNTQEQPFREAGYGATSQLNYLLGQGTPGDGSTATSSSAGGYGSLTAPFTMQNFEQLSPAYNFQKQQGQQGVLNGAAAGQGAMSGAALKDLTDYNQGLAGTSFNNAFNQYQTQQGNIFSRLSGIATLGQNATANAGAQGTALAGQAAQSATNIGTAGAAGTIGAANAITGGLSSAAPWLAYGGGGSGGGGGGWGDNYTSADGYTSTQNVGH
jgi:hypothetical protein